MATDYKYLKENNLYEAHKAFMRLCEGYGYSPIEEDDNAEQGGMPQDGGMPDPNAVGMDGGQGGMPDSPMGQEPMPPADGGMGDGMNNGGQPQDPSQGMDGQNPNQLPPVGDVSDVQPEEEAEDEDVIDVDQMTDAQQKTFDKVNSLGRDLGKTDSRIQKLLGAIEAMKGMIDSNNSQIEDLKKEIEKRNPTQTEKLNLRSLDSYPFNVKPSDYWAEKEKNSNYSAYADNDEPTQDEYVITNNDIDDLSDREIEQSFVPSELIQDINRIFGIKK